MRKHSLWLCLEAALVWSLVERAFPPRFDLNLSGTSALLVDERETTLLPAQVQIVIIIGLRVIVMLVIVVFTAIFVLLASTGSWLGGRWLFDLAAKIGLTFWLALLVLVVTPLFCLSFKRVMYINWNLVLSEGSWSITMVLQFLLYEVKVDILRNLMRTLDLWWMPSNKIKTTDRTAKIIWARGLHILRMRPFMPASWGDQVRRWLLKLLPCLSECSSQKVSWAR